MAKQEDKYNVTMKFDVSITKDGEKDAKPWYGTTGEITYVGMDYLQVCGVNAALVKFAEILVDLGFDGAILAGFPVETVKAIKSKLM